MSGWIFLLVLGLALWLAALVWNAWNARGVSPLSGAMEFPLQERPRVSILIPARNEAEILRTTLPAFLSQDYDNYEVILVDDASTDETPELAKRFAALHPRRFRVLRVESLPENWVGKPHALHRAFEQAQGEWVLATDADIHFHPQALRAGLWLAQQQQAALVSIGAFLECGSFWEKMLLPNFGLILATVFPLRRINDPRSSVALASGGYILMRRRVWADLGGYEAIRAEMIDDLNTARIVKHAGHRIFVAVTRDLVRTRMYSNFREIWEGLRKNAFAAHRFSVARTLGWCSLALLTNLVPLLGLAWGATSWLQGREAVAGPLGVIVGLSLAQYALSASLHAPLVSFYRIRLGYALLAPWAALLYVGIAMDSMLRTLLGKGVSWKLRQYGKPSLESES